jgi:hypothetical protein
MALLASQRSTKVSPANPLHSFKDLQAYFLRNDRNKSFLNKLLGKAPPSTMWSSLPPAT